MAAVPSGLGPAARLQPAYPADGHRDAALTREGRPLAWTPRLSMVTPPPRPVTALDRETGARV
jgi:hypothetical protein